MDSELVRLRTQRLADALRAFGLVDRFGLGRLLHDVAVPTTREFEAVLRRSSYVLPRSISAHDLAAMLRDAVVDAESDASRALKSSVDELLAVPAGRAHADEYHEAVLKVLGLALDGQAVVHGKEVLQNGGRKRIDLVLRTFHEASFFGTLPAKFGIACALVPVECKNYSDDVGNPELDQLSGRLNKHVGQIGLLTCRRVSDPRALEERLRAYKAKDELLLVLNDSDIVRMVQQRRRCTIEDVLHAKLAELLLL